jgi:hypothetical protein
MVVISRRVMLQCSPTAVVVIGNLPNSMMTQLHFAVSESSPTCAVIAGSAPPDRAIRYNSLMRIGPYLIDPPVGLAPMAGVTDKPFRQLCKRLGAGLAVSEMTTSHPRLWTTRKSLKRMDHAGEPDPVSVQIAGYDPAMLAELRLQRRPARRSSTSTWAARQKVCNVRRLGTADGPGLRILVAVVAP